MIRDRLALAVSGVTVGALPVIALLATVEGTRRPTDVAVLWLAGALQLGMVMTWAFVPRLPKWIVAGWGLILAATGIGVAIAAPIADGAGSTTPWGVFGLVVVGLLTMIMAAVHSSGGSDLIG